MKVIDQVNYAVEKGDIVGNKDKCILIFLKIALQPFDMHRIQVVGGLVQKEDIGFLEQQLSQHLTGWRVVFLYS